MGMRQSVTRSRQYPAEICIESRLLITSDDTEDDTTASYVIYIHGYPVYPRICNVRSESPVNAYNVRYQRPATAYIFDDTIIYSYQCRYCYIIH